jgi:outer membrane receptor protein involved in Fe transport
VIQITGTRRGSEIAGVSTPVQVIAAEALSERTPEVLTDALREAPNVHVQATTVGQGSPYVRGLTGSAVLNLVDGMRLNHAIYRSSPNPYLALVDSHVARRVEILRGPASVLYGSDAMGGVIQVVTRKPEFHSAEWETRGGVDARFGSADLSRSVHADLAAGREGLGIGAGFSYLAAEDLRGGGDTGRQHPAAYTRHSTSRCFDSPKRRATTSWWPDSGRPSPPSTCGITSRWSESSATCNTAWKTYCPATSTS